MHRAADAHVLCRSRGDPRKKSTVATMQGEWVLLFFWELVASYSSPFRTNIKGNCTWTHRLEIKVVR